MPKKGDFRVAISVLGLILVLGVSFTSYYLYKRIGIDKPLERKIAALEGVQSSQISKRNDDYLIEVRLKKVDNLQEAYNSISRCVEDSLGGQSYTLRISDRPNEKLQEFVQHMQPAIFETLDSSKFIWLDQETARRTSEAGLQYKLFIDQQRLYLQIMDADYYIYQVVERSNQASGDNQAKL